MTAPTGRVMGLDIGDRTIGIAISDPGWIIATGVTTVRRTRPADDLEALRALVEAHEITRLVVGWPLRLDGQPGEQTRKVGVLARAIREALGLPVERMDERLTTVAAERALREGGVHGRERRQVVDQVAATLILQGWLDRRQARRRRAEEDGAAG
ncbi:MAG: Holliday junction resolvase RuvX [Myxococcales bacterium]|nr:Holliday junction resolvase RuvX [Myxococcales bacterium]MCB9545862.1 Holliday junction resolvase RuvX [Myxococcales bacterium]